MRKGCESWDCSSLRRLKGDLIKTRVNGHKLKHSGYLLNIREHFLTVRVTEHWHRLPREVLESPSSSPTEKEWPMICVDSRAYKLLSIFDCKRFLPVIEAAMTLYLKLLLRLLIPSSCAQPLPCCLEEGEEKVAKCLSLPPCCPLRRLYLRSLLLQHQHRQAEHRVRCTLQEALAFRGPGKLPLKPSLSRLNKPWSQSLSSQSKCSSHDQLAQETPTFLTTGVDHAKGKPAQAEPRTSNLYQVF
ncbi:hypothetical protein QYF61_025367 [Mycteria americana]|uniref:Uncharacterized protein n=1 Tax=Mycteria americana TaxID=33587 RepID=A0AAN7S5K8_MYCAM|nr:hypothetical protein QYF61_025367 [Mycteria americana]